MFPDFCVADDLSAAYHAAAMKLVSVVICNFRGYARLTRVPIGELTAFVGKNDVGKSTILDALEIFFNSETVKLDHNDPTKGSNNTVVRIGCEFAGFPAEVVIDANARTSLPGEHLLNELGNLEIHKLWDCAKTKIVPDVVVVAAHPTVANGHDLLQLKNTDLKKRLAALEVNTDTVNLAVNSSIRRAIWTRLGDLQIREKEIPISKLADDQKNLWDALEKLLPRFALFQSDRPSKDNDSEVQDPMAVAVKAAIAEEQDSLRAIEERVRMKATEVADRTIEKLRDIDERLATRLTPEFSAQPKWDGFKLTLRSEDGIPINKRGSGVRRLILLSFFRAEAEHSNATSNGLIYAIEEPETSQHPENQRLLMEAFASVSSISGAQVMITTHNPAFAGLLATNDVQYVRRSDAGDVEVLRCDEEVLSRVANELGVLPDNRVEVLACLEGPNDVLFLRHISRIFHAQDATIPDLNGDPRVAMLPLGGSTLQQWVQNHYLRDLNRPEIHLYDRDDEGTPAHQAEVDRVNGRGGRSYACSTGKREIENYLHPDAIFEALNVRVVFGDFDDVPAIVAAAVHNAAPDAARPWAELEEEKRSEKMKHAKRRLCNDAAARMTADRLAQSDANGDLRDWFIHLSQMLSPRIAVDEAAAAAPIPEL